MGIPGALLANTSLLTCLLAYLGRAARVKWGTPRAEALTPSSPFSPGILMVLEDGCPPPLRGRLALRQTPRAEGRSWRVVAGNPPWHSGRNCKHWQRLTRDLGGPCGISNVKREEDNGGDRIYERRRLCSFTLWMWIAGGLRGVGSGWNYERRDYVL